MAKIKVHELAKELEVQSKDILSFLQGKGIEAKAAQSSIDEEASQLVRSAFSKEAKSGNRAETPKKKETAKEETAGMGKEETAKTPDKETVKPVAKAADAQANGAPKKKKTIIVVNNPQNSRMQGQRPAQGGTNARRQSGQGNQGGQGKAQGGRGNDRRPQAQAPVRPIKPLTPPSPTPSVQMVPPKPQQPKARPDQNAVRKTQTPGHEAA